ncbi:MAG: 30S ribosome-binding factor RbfA [Thermoplasmata archaeon]
MRPFRRERVASLVHEIVGDVVAHGLNDPRVEPLTTVTRVEVAGDLMFATVYVSVPGGETAERRTLTAIRHAAGHMQRILGGQLTMRQCPALRFEVDESVKIARRTLELLAEEHRKHPEVFPQDASSEADADAEEAVEDDGDGAGSGSLLP